MSEIGYGYGSEWHLLRYLGYHRNALNHAIGSRLGLSSIEWIDHQCDSRRRFLDVEWKGMDFLPSELLHVKDCWKAYWPQTGNVQNWDAVGWATSGDHRELLLVEAKSHLAEIQTSCGAKEHGGRPQIREAMKIAQQHFGVGTDMDWLAPHYQYCNRLAALAFLTRMGVPTRLVHIYFVGDKVPQKTCPSTEAEWLQALRNVKMKIGLTTQATLGDRILELFLPTLAPPLPEGSS